MYHYLFYTAYKMALKTTKWNDTPIFYSSGVVLICFFFNLMTVFALLEAFTKTNYLTQIFDKFVTIKYLVGAILCAVMYYYYAFNGRGHKIYLKYARKRVNSKEAHPLLIMIFYSALSFFLFMISVMYMKGDGFFA